MGGYQAETGREVILVAKKKQLSFDSKCYDLAEHFLEDEPTLNNEDARNELAQEIQETVETWIIDQRDKRDVKDPA
jgi:hypothetical protein